MSTRLSLLLASGLMAAAPVAFADTAPPTAIEHVSTTAPAPAPAAKSDASRYASRETQDKQVQDYKGGSVVVVGISGGAVLVLLILLILLV